jgi:hypothetical protein
MSVSVHNSRGSFSVLSKKWLAVLAAGGVGVTLAIAGCGGSSNGPNSPSPGKGAPARTTAVPAKPPTAGRPPAGTAQHNGGDQDPDNNGGPDDGDGTI